MSTENWLNPDGNWTDIGGEADAQRSRLLASDDYRHYIEDLRAVVRTPAGARVVCGLLDALGAFEPAWTEKNAVLARRAVLRDFGQSLLDDLAVAADDVHDDIQRMMRIRRKAADQLLTVDQNKE